jgi:iron(III) transport system ATP-binding protein
MKKLRGMRQVAVTGLHKAFGAHPVLTGVDLEVPAGSLTAILGPSGSGKTTLLRLLAGFERADAGTISIGDSLVDGPGVYVAPERRRIGYVPQEGSLFPHLTVEANVGFGLAARDRRAGRAASMLEMVGLAGLGRRYPHQLSGGQQQRVALARALAIEPAVVLLDEPFASLDAHLRASVRADVQDIFRRAGTTAVLVTHDQDEALSVADRVAALRDGTIAQYAAPEDLYCRPVDAGLASFVGEANLLEGVLNGAMVKTLLGNLLLDPPRAD